MNVLLSIKPEFAEKILSGEKHYEFRKTRFSDPESVHRVYLYSSSPDQKIVGSFELDNVIEASPVELWDQFGDVSGISEQSRFMDYFGEADTGIALGISDVNRFSKPIDPWTLFQDFHPPVSFQYIENSSSLWETNNLTQTGSD